MWTMSDNTLQPDSSGHGEKLGFWQMYHLVPGFKAPLLIHNAADSPSVSLDSSVGVHGSLTEPISTGSYQHLCGTHSNGEHRSASNVTIFQQGVFPSPSATYNPELDNQAAGYDTGCRTVQPMPAQSLTYHTETSDSIDDESVSSHFTLPSGTSASMEMLNSTAVSEMYSLHQQRFLLLGRDPHGSIVLTPAEFAGTQSNQGLPECDADGRELGTVIHMPDVTSRDVYTFQTRMPSIQENGCSDVIKVSGCVADSFILSSVPFTCQAGGLPYEDRSAGDKMNCVPSFGNTAMYSAKRHLTSFDSTVTDVAIPVGVAVGNDVTESQGFKPVDVASADAEPCIVSNFPGGKPDEMDVGPATLCSTVDARVTFNNTGSISMASKAIETNPIDDTSVTLRTSVMDDSWMYDSALNVDRRDLMCTHSQSSVRRSQRLVDQEKLDQQNLRPTYKSCLYDVEQLWCDECQMAYDGQCPAHRLVPVLDKVVLSCARASIPGILQIVEVSPCVDNDIRPAAEETAVFAKRSVSKMTRFGPLVACLADGLDLVSNNTFPLMLERRGGIKWYLDTADENKCNWMMFVRPASSFEEQNLVAYQHGEEIFFVTTRTIEPKEELKVWYAPHYAERLGRRHLVAQSGHSRTDPHPPPFPCVCSGRFQSPFLLKQRALDGHGGDLADDDSCCAIGEDSEIHDNPSDEDWADAAVRRSIWKGGEDRRKAAARCPLKFHGKNLADSYVKKTLRKYRKRRGRVAVGSSSHERQRVGWFPRRCRVSRLGVRGVAEERSCGVCGLVFDDASLLNLHAMTHDAEAASGHPCAVDWSSMATSIGSRDGGGELTSCTLSSEMPLKCPACQLLLPSRLSLVSHVTTHGRAPMPPQLHKCPHCRKGFPLRSKLKKHILCHISDESKPLVCEFCSRRFLNNSALGCHLKTHSKDKYYQCPVCNEGFDNIRLMKKHIILHADADGRFCCHGCDKVFSDFHIFRKHLKNFHSGKQFSCPECDKPFPQQEKLKLHMLRHTTHREFLCEMCGCQYKRKDKLKEHLKRAHGADGKPMSVARSCRGGGQRKFVPKVSPTDYHRFIYKCHLCMLGFKRRGMLVNHLNKRHTGVSPESIHELNLPILRQQRDYFCQYCDKVYKSSSKRKVHILKVHPGSDLPPGACRKAAGDGVGVSDSTYSRFARSVMAMPQSCQLCHKQYASKAKLMHHQRKQHPDGVSSSSLAVPSTTSVSRSSTEGGLPNLESCLQSASSLHVDDVVIATDGVHSFVNCDLLRQAMSEVFQPELLQPADAAVQQAEPTQLGRLVMLSDRSSAAGLCWGLQPTNH